MTDVTNRGRDLRIALLWHNPDSANLGVGALSRAHHAILTEVVAGLGRTLEVRWLGNGQRANGLRVTSRDIAAGAFGSDSFTAVLEGVVLAFDIAEGDSLTDLYGVRRFGRIVGLSEVVVRRGIPVVTAPQTIGPFRSSATRSVAARALRRRSSTWVRDAESVGVVRTLVPGATAHLASDAAFRLDLAPAELPDSSKLRIGLNVSGLLMRDPEQRRRMNNNYGSTVFALAQWLDGLNGVEVHLVPHVMGLQTDVDSDEGVARQLVDRFPDMVMAENLRTPEQAKGYISRLDGLIASRMHACIAALSTGVPVLPLSYSPKFRGLFASLGYDATVDLETSSADNVVQATEAFLDERPDWAHSAGTANDLALRRLDRYAAGVRELLDDA